MRWDLRPCRFDKGYFWGELASLIAAFNVAHGTVISSLYRRHRSTEFTKFLVKIDTDVPDELEVHLIWDNYAPHHDHLAAGTPAVPCALHADLLVLDQPDGAILRLIVVDLLVRSDHRCVQALETRIRAWANTWNDNLRPFI